MCASLQQWPTWIWPCAVGWSWGDHPEVEQQARLKAVGRHGCRTLVGEPQQFPITEAVPTNPVHPYAQTRLRISFTGPADLDAWLAAHG